MNHLGLFEGIGGFSLAARWMGWETVAWCEWDPFCQQVLRKNFPEVKEENQHGDITKTDFTRYAGTIDVLTGGFPCQPFSQAGRRKGKEDDRYLWPEMLRAIREIQPSIVVAENVRGLLNISGGLVFKQVLSDLEDEGYEVLPFLIPACAVNAPHRRDRIWIVAHRTNSGTKRMRRRENKVHGLQSISDPESARLERKNRISMDSTKEFAESITTNTSSLRQSRKKYRQKESRRTTKESIRIDWQDFPTQSGVRQGDDGLSPWLVKQSIKAYGNAIVPQVAFEIFKAIQKIDEHTN
jgi:DNA (cytosine-5)-methyltransferase 1